jgi:hypothetical protein
VGGANENRRFPDPERRAAERAGSREKLVGARRMDETLSTVGLGLEEFNVGGGSQS